MKSKPNKPQKKLNKMNRPKNKRKKKLAKRKLMSRQSTKLKRRPYIKNIKKISLNKKRRKRNWKKL